MRTVLLWGLLLATTPATAEPTDHAIRPRLGRAFGTVVKVTADVRERPDDPNTKADEHAWLVEVITVDGAPLPTPATLLLDARPHPPAGRHTLIGYETVTLRGIPHGLMRHPEMRDYPIEAGVGFHPEWSFVVLKVVAQE